MSIVWSGVMLQKAEEQISIRHFLSENWKQTHWSSPSSVVPTDVFVYLEKSQVLRIGWLRDLRVDKTFPLLVSFICQSYVWFGVSRRLLISPNYFQMTRRRWIIVERSDDLCWEHKTAISRKELEVMSFFDFFQLLTVVIIFIPSHIIRRMKETCLYRFASALIFLRNDRSSQFLFQLLCWFTAK